MSHMVTSEKDMTNLKDSGTRDTVGDSRALTGTKHGDWNSYRIRDRKIYHVRL